MANFVNDLVRFRDYVPTIAAALIEAAASIGGDPWEAPILIALTAAQTFLEG